MEGSKASVVSEFAGAELGDKRLNKRLKKVVGAIEAQPAVGFPKAMLTCADTEGFYRMMRNEKVTHDALLAPHLQATATRAREHGEVLVVHDTTEFRFTGDRGREGLGKLNRSGHGFLSHFSLVLSADGERDVLGVAAVHSWARLEETPTAKRRAKKVSYTETTEMKRESERWFEGVTKSDEVLSEVDTIHLADSEADDFAFLSAMVTTERRFVVRGCYDRLLDTEQTGAERGARLKDFAADIEGICTRSVTLSRKRKAPGRGKKRSPARSEREASLSFSAASIVIARPHSQPKHLPETIRLNLVYVSEIDPPANTEPVEWLLLTSEPIDSEEKVLRVVDFYRARWVVEEYFKALKTGCAYEKRQLESWHTLLNALAIFIPVAWNLLRMRSLSRNHPDAPASLVLTDAHVQILRAVPETKRMKLDTVRDAFLAIARLGGHLKQNGDPGWQVLGRGYEDLLKYEFGFRIALERDAINL